MYMVKSTREERSWLQRKKGMGVGDCMGQKKRQYRSSVLMYEDNRDQTCHVWLYMEENGQHNTNVSGGDVALSYTTVPFRMEYCCQ